MTLTPMSQALAGVGLIALCLSGAATAGGICNPKSGISTIGLEYVSSACPAGENSQIDYQVNAFECKNGQISRYAVYGSSYLTPASLSNTANQVPSNTFRAYRNRLGTHFLMVHKNYKGTLKLDDSGQAVTPAVALSTSAACGVAYVPPAPDRNPGACDENCTNPINGGWRGNKYQALVDYQARHPIPFEFGWHYNSQRLPFLMYPGDPRYTPNLPLLGFDKDFAINIAVGTYSEQPPVSQLPPSTPGVAGSWQTSYSRYLVQLASDNVALRRDDGKTFGFRLVAGQWKGQADESGRLSQIAGQGWSYVNPQGDTERYDLRGKLTGLTKLGGQTLSFGYNGAGQLSQIGDAFGNQLTLVYDSAGKLQKLTDAANGNTVYAYDGNGMLSSVTYPDNSVRRYEYNNALFPTALTDIFDESNQGSAKWTYDAQGRATSSAHGLGQQGQETDRSDVTYLSDTQYNVTTAQGGVYQFTVADVVGTKRIVSRQRAGAASTLGYDANGNVSNRTDFNGTSTTYVYDLTRNLETSRTEAAGTPQARTTTTTWHPTLRLPATITEPGRVTEFNYDPNGNLLSKKVTADGVSRTQSWSYLANGLLDTATDARGKVTRYTYDAQGNLATVTNP
ncbi:hypothetical protein, partial [Chitiniphilus shinanonensis]|uniref:hypothetical protein n=1 Tax=Chitiniphilus shinanonensis TaxID=553088 RepID=UPI0024E116A2